MTDPRVGYYDGRCALPDIGCDYGGRALRWRNGGDWLFVVAAMEIMNTLPGHAAY